MTVIFVRVDEHVPVTLTTTATPAQARELVKALNGMLHISEAFALANDS